MKDDRRFSSVYDAIGGEISADKSPYDKAPLGVVKPLVDFGRCEAKGPCVQVIFYSCKERQILAERWRLYYNTQRPHSSLGYRPPAPKACPIEASLGHGKVESKNRLQTSGD